MPNSLAQNGITIASQDYKIFQLRIDITTMPAQHIPMLLIYLAKHLRYTDRGDNKLMETGNKRERGGCMLTF